jgi:hypothetical protein
MVVLAIVFVTFFGAGIVFGLNLIYSRSVRRMLKPPTPAGEAPADDDARQQVWPYSR